MGCSFRQNQHDPSVGVQPRRQRGADIVRKPVPNPTQPRFTSAALQPIVNTRLEIGVRAEQQRQLLSLNSEDTGPKPYSGKQTSNIDKQAPIEEDSGPGIWSFLNALIIISCALIASLALALGHHFLYRRVQGRAINDVSISQSWMLRFGTDFAFLVSTTFGISVGTSYVQYQWLKLRRTSFRVDEIDCLTDVLKNALRFFYSLVFFKQPILFLMAVVAW